MNGPDDFERELAAMQPRAPSPNLERRIGALLAKAPQPTASNDRRGVRFRSIAAGLLAASFAAFALWLAGNEVDNRQTTADSIEIESAVVFDESLPSVWSYRTASKQSGDSLEVLLDRHGQKSRTRQSAGDRLAAFSPLDQGAAFLGIEL